jgi:hypothetical protein
VIDLYGEPWNAGVWVSNRTGDTEQAKITRSKMNEKQLERLLELPYGVPYTAAEALDVLRHEVMRRRQTDPEWKISKSFTMKAPWDGEWEAGQWVCHRLCSGQEADYLRSVMSKRELEDLEALPYNKGAPLSKSSKQLAP